MGDWELALGSIFISSCTCPPTPERERERGRPSGISCPSLRRITIIRIFHVAGKIPVNNSRDPCHLVSILCGERTIGASLSLFPRRGHRSPSVGGRRKGAKLHPCENEGCSSGAPRGVLFTFAFPSSRIHVFWSIARIRSLLLLPRACD